MSSTSIVERTAIQDLKDPILVTAFASQQQGGATASTALSYAVQRWQVEPVANFEAEGCYNYARMRPWVRRENETVVVHWPENLVYRIEGPEHSYLLLVGVEPQLNWREFAEGIGDFALALGIRTAVNLKSFPAMVPHTLKAPVRAIYSPPEIKQEYAFKELDDQDGPADIGRILNLYLASKGCRTIDLYAMEPFYATANADASASISLLLALKEGFDLTVDLQGLREAADVQRKSIDEAVSSSEQLRDTVSALEHGLGSIDNGQELLPARGSAHVELDSAAVISEAEAIFREFTDELSSGELRT